MPPDDRRDDDNDPDLERFLADGRRFMAECPTLWLDLGDASPAPPLEAAEIKTDALVAEAHANRAGQDYPTADQLLANLPTVLRALCDHLLNVYPTARDVARRLASVIDAVENVPARATATRQGRIAALGVDRMAPPPSWLRRPTRMLLDWPDRRIPGCGSTSPIEAARDRNP